MELKKKKKNQERLQSTSLPFSRLYQDMYERLCEFKSIQEDPQPEPIHSEVTRWTPPQNSQLNVNYDGAIFNDFQQARVGVVVRDAAGVVRGALSDKFTLPMNVEDVEALACKLVVVFALELGLREMVFEGESETITKGLFGSLFLITHHSKYQGCLVPSLTIFTLFGAPRLSW